MDLDEVKGEVEGGVAVDRADASGFDSDRTMMLIAIVAFASALFVPTIGAVIAIVGAAAAALRLATGRGSTRVSIVVLTLMVLLVLALYAPVLVML